MKVYFGENTLESYISAKSHLNNDGRNIIIIDADEIQNISEITQHINGIGLFGESNIVFAKRLFKNKKVLKHLEDDESIINSDALIVWNEGTLDKRTKLVKTLNKQNKLMEFNLPKSYKYPEWIRVHSRKYFGINLKNEHANYIFEMVGENVWFVHMELRKLKTFMGKSKDINLRDLSQIVTNYRYGSIWDLLDAFGNDNKARMSQIFPKLIKESKDVHYIISMINRELRLISQVKDIENLATKSIHPYVLKKTKDKQSNFSDDKLKEKYIGLLMLDTKIKNGEIDPEIGLYEYLFT